MRSGAVRSGVVWFPGIRCGVPGDDSVGDPRRAGGGSLAGVARQSATRIVGPVEESAPRHRLLDQLACAARLADRDARRLVHRQRSTLVVSAVLYGGVSKAAACRAGDLTRQAVDQAIQAVLGVQRLTGEEFDRARVQRRPDLEIQGAGDALAEAAAAVRFVDAHAQAAVPGAGPPHRAPDRARRHHGRPRREDRAQARHGRPDPGPRPRCVTPHSPMACSRALCATRGGGRATSATEVGRRAAPRGPRPRTRGAGRGRGCGGRLPPGRRVRRGRRAGRGAEPAAPTRGPGTAGRDGPPGRRGRAPRPQPRRAGGHSLKLLCADRVAC